MLYRFAIQLADVDRSVYEDLDVRAHMHPSEDVPWLLTRVLAYALEYEDGLEFGKGLSDAEEPALWRRSPEGRPLLWIDVGAPTPDRLHKVAKHAERVVVWCHRRPDLLRQKCAKEGVHKAESIRLVEVPSSLLDRLAEQLDRNNKWDVSVHDGQVTIVIGGNAGGAVVEAVLPSGPLVAKE